MPDVQVKLAALWVAVMLTYLLGDVLRIFAGDFRPGEISGIKMTDAMLVGVAALMLVPIVMVLLSLTLDQPLSRWVNIVAAALLFVLNLIGLPTYAGMYDKFLIAVSLAMNAATIWIAWNWRA